VVEYRQGAIANFEAPLLHVTGGALMALRVPNHDARRSGGFFFNSILIILLTVLVVAAILFGSYLYVTSFVDVVLRDSAYNLERLFALSLDSPTDIFETCKDIATEQELIVEKVLAFSLLPRREKERIVTYLRQSKELVSRKYELYRMLQAFQSAGGSAGAMFQPGTLLNSAQSLVDSSKTYHLTYQHLLEMERLLMTRLQEVVTGEYAVVERHNPTKHDLVIKAEEIIAEKPE